MSSMDGGAGGGDVESDLPSRRRECEVLFVGGAGLLNGRDERCSRAEPVCSGSVFTRLAGRGFAAAALGVDDLFVLAEGAHGSLRAITDHSGRQLVFRVLAEWSVAARCKHGQ